MFKENQHNKRGIEEIFEWKCSYLYKKKERKVSEPPTLTPPALSPNASIDSFECKENTQTQSVV